MQADTNQTSLKLLWDELRHQKSKKNKYQSHILYILDNKCITEHKHFESIVLLKDVLWMALVGMHDREGSLLPKRDNVPNRYAILFEAVFKAHVAASLKCFIAENL